MQTGGDYTDFYFIDILAVSSRTETCLEIVPVQFFPFRFAKARFVFNNIFYEEVDRGERITTKSKKFKKKGLV